jgi:hypothetical protein
MEVVGGEPHVLGGGIHAGQRWSRHRGEVGVCRPACAEHTSPAPQRPVPHMPPRNPRGGQRHCLAGTK